MASLQRVLITGGNRGLGLEFVRQCLERGNRVFAGCRNLDRAMDLHTLSAAQPWHLTIVTLDVTDEGGVERALEGGEMLVHSAACYSFWERDPEHIYRVNVLGTRNVLRAAARQGYRKIVYTSSASTLTPSMAGATGTEEALFDATDKALDSVKRLVDERTDEGDVVIVAGIGNTVGISQ